MIPGLLLYGIILFLVVGRMNWVEGWVYLGLNTLTQLLSAAILIPRQPELLAERSQVRPDTISWDRCPGYYSHPPTFIMVSN